MNDENLLRRFEAANLSPEEWHHREHVRIAYLYLVRWPPAEALGRMRTGLQALNAAQRVPDTLERGYHETLTRGWLHLMQAALSEYGPAADSESFLEEHSHLLARRALYFFYSKARLRSAAAKATWVEPDLAPLPLIRRPFPTASS